MRRRSMLNAGGNCWRAIAVRVLVACCTFSILCGWRAAVADTDRSEFENLFRELITAREIVLMTVPRGMLFRVSVTKEQLPKVACVYRISSTNPVFGDTLDILRTGILEYAKGATVIGEIRIGVLFQGNGVSHEFYFEDWSGRQNVNGVSGDYRMLASAHLPDGLRALVLRPGVLLVSGRLRDCSQQ
jgi:hypothetical protein